MKNEEFIYSGDGNRSDFTTDVFFSNTNDLELKRIYMIILLTIRFEFFNPRSKIKMITYGYLVKFCVIKFNSVYVCCAIIVFRQ